MDHKNSAIPLISGAVFVALVVGVSLWAMRPHASTGPGRATTEQSSDTPIATGTLATRPPATNSMPAPSTAPDPGQDLMAIVAANDEAAAKVAEAGERKLRSRYESERVDPKWAPGKQQALERLSVSPQIEQLNARPVSIDAHCRTSVCLINAEFQTRLAATDWHTLYTLNAGTEMFNSSTRSTVNPDGSVHLQIYGLARQ